jgi:hypothetical protein
MSSSGWDLDWSQRHTWDLHTTVYYVARTLQSSVQRQPFIWPGTTVQYSTMELCVIPFKVIICGFAKLTSSTKNVWATKALLYKGSILTISFSLFSTPTHIDKEFHLVKR